MYACQCGFCWQGLTLALSGHSLAGDELRDMTMAMARQLEMLTKAVDDLKHVSHRWMERAEACFAVTTPPSLCHLSAA